MDGDERDGDGDGMDEFEAMRHQAKYDCCTLIAQEFTSMDTNGDGVVSLAEMQDAVLSNP